MNLDETIKHAEEVAEEQEGRGYCDRNVCVIMNGCDKCEVVKCRECADNHRQLAEWLKELKEYRKMPIDKAGILKTLKELRQEFVEELESLQESHDWGRVYGMEIAIEMIGHKIEEVQNDD